MCGVPAPHSVHDAAPATVLYCPLRHAVQPLAFTPLTYPTLQAAHVDHPAVAYRPAGQPVQAAAPDAALTVPLAHAAPVKERETAKEAHKLQNCNADSNECVYGREEGGGVVVMASTTNWRECT